MSRADQTKPAPETPPPGMVFACRWLPGVVLVLAVVLAWANTFTAPFEFDDFDSIVRNASLRDLGSFRWLNPPATGGETVGGRPVLNLTFAINHALGGTSVTGYHVTNLAIHALAALALFGLVRRSAAGRPGAGGGRVAATLLALAASLVWALHPLQTESVTYVVQRAESLCGLLYLFTLYAFSRAVPEGREGGPSRPWFAAAWLSCALAMGVKEVAATVPLVVLLYDRAFVSGSLRAALRSRWRWHAALGSTWLIVGVLALHGRGQSAGLGGGIGSWDYLLTQCRAIGLYLRLALWPAGQVFDHGVPLAGGLTEVWPQALLLAALAGVSAWALWRNTAAGFLGAAFFLVLAPSSSFVPVVTQTIAEHRMYLALAPLVLAAALGVRALAERPGLRAAWCACLAAAVAVALGAATFARNRVYRSELALWTETATACPMNPRAHYNLGLALAGAGRPLEAEAEYRRALALRPNHAFAHFALAVLLEGRSAGDEALAHYQAAVQADPHYVAARVNLGQMLSRQGRPAEAEAQYRAALADDPGAGDVKTSLATLLIDGGRLGEASALLREVLAARPESAQAHYALGMALDKAHDAGAEDEFREALRLAPTMAAAHLALGNCLVRRGSPGEAEAAYRRAAELNPGSAEARFALGNALVRQRRVSEAIEAYHEALQLDPSHIQALNNLGNCEMVTGHAAEAARIYRRVLELRPDDPTASRNLRVANEILSDGAAQ